MAADEREAPGERGEPTEVQRLQQELAKSEKKREKLTATLTLLRERAQNTGEAIKRVVEVKKQLREEQGLRAMAEAALEEQRHEAAAAAAQAAAAQAAAQAATKAAEGACAQAAATAKKLAEVQAQMVRLQAQCADLRKAAAAAERQQAGSAAPEGLQQQLRLLQSQQGDVLAEMQRWRAALGPLAALAAGTDAPPAAAAVAKPAARQPGQKQQQQHGPASPKQPAVAAAPPPDARAMAVAARHAAAAGKRPRAATQRAAVPAQAGVFAALLKEVDSKPAAGSPTAKRPRRSAAAQPREAAAPAAAAPAAAALVAAEASLAVSANEPHAEQQREAATAADEAAQLLGRITAATAGREGGASLALVQGVAADLQLRLANHHLPLPLLLTCFETAVLECAAPKPQLQYLEQQAAVATADGGAAAAGGAALGSWFEAGGEQQPAGGATPRFAAVWSLREALAGHRLRWLLHCAAHVHRLERQYAAATAAAAGSPRAVAGQDGQPFLPVLRLHLHRLVVGCCLALGGGRGSGGSEAARISTLRHTETEVCALAAAAAGLCRVAADAEAMWALVLDLAACPVSASTVLPPLAAALDVWPEVVGHVGTAAAAASSPGRLSPAVLHAALQRLCGEAACGEEQARAAGESCEPPALLLERQPEAAAVCLRRLGRAAWGWDERAAGGSGAVDALRAALGATAAGAEHGTQVTAAAAAGAGEAAMEDLAEEEI